MFANEYLGIREVSELEGMGVCREKMRLRGACLTVFPYLRVCRGEGLSLHLYLTPACLVISHSLLYIP